jgi:hypothetical protein
LWLATSFLGAEVIFFLFRLFSLFFLPLMVPSLGVLSLAGSFRCLFLLFGLSARFMLLGWVFFTWVYFLLEPFFLKPTKPLCRKGALFFLAFLASPSPGRDPTQS